MNRTQSPIASKGKFNRFVTTNPDIIESFPGVLPARKAAVAAPNPSQTPPHGYTMVESDSHEISSRDMVFLGGLRSYWLPARRAGEVGSLRGDSMAVSVAVLSA